MRSIEFHDYYKLLGLPAAATAAEIKARYRALSKLHHPDRGGDQAEMAQINQAYGVLSDTFKRNIYDAERRRHLQQAQSVKQKSTLRNNRPAPRAYSPFATSSTRRRSAWWPKFALAFASLVIAGGILLHLPVAEAIGTPSGTTETAIKPLDITYPVETVPSAQNAASSAPTTIDSSSVSTPQPAQQSSTPSSDLPPTPTDKKEKLREFCTLITKSRICTENKESDR